MFYFICVKAITMSFNKPFCIQKSKTRLPLLLIIWSLHSVVRTVLQRAQRQSTWSLLSDYKVSSESPPSQNKMPSFFLGKGRWGFRHFSACFTYSMSWLTPYHSAALKPSEEDETVAPFGFNSRWLGHETSSVGGSSLTFLQEHHNNH